jgi:hypothetical protein
MTTILQMTILALTEATLFRRASNIHYFRTINYVSLVTRHSSLTRAKIRHVLLLILRHSDDN